MQGLTRVSALLVWLTLTSNTASATEDPTRIWDCPPINRKSVGTDRTPKNGIYREGLVDLRINGAMHDQPVYVLINDSRQIFIADCDFIALRLRAKPLRLTVNQVFVVPLSNQEWVKSQFDESRDQLDLIIDPIWFEPTQIDLSRRGASEIRHGSTGATLNYFAQLSEPQGRGIHKGLTLDGSVFGKLGFLQSSTQLSWVTDSDGRAEERQTRLGSRWIIDFPESRHSLQIGDGTTVDSHATPAIRYAGVSFGSNFDLDPGFSPYASVFVAGSARVPSTADLLLNDRRIGPSVDLPAGQFRIDRIPTVEGTGVVRILIRDVLGNEQSLMLPYFKSSRLLAPGVHQHASTIGSQRVDYDQYKQPFALTAHRLGVTDALTVSLSGAVDNDHQSLGLGAAFRLTGPWVAELSGATSNSLQGSGNRFEFALNRQAFRELGFGLSVRQASRRFILIGDNSNTAAIDPDTLFIRPVERQLSTLFLTRHLGQLGALSLSHTQRGYWTDHPSQRLTTLSWGKSFAPGVTFSMSFSNSSDSRVLFAGLSIALDPRRYVNLSLNSRRPERQKETHDLAAEYFYALPVDEGFGARLGRIQRLGENTTPQALASDTTLLGGYLRSKMGLHAIDIEDRGGRQAWRAQTSGAIGWIEGTPFFAPPIDGGFALVSTKDAAQIPIYRENNRVTETNDRGVAVMTQMRPFETNRLSIDPDDVPLQYSVGQATWEVIPRTRGGVFIEFDLTRESAAIVQLTDTRGQDIPRGATVFVRETREGYSVGLRGEVYITNLPKVSRLRVSHLDQSCEIEVSRPDAKDPQPRLGPVICDLQPQGLQ